MDNELLDNVFFWGYIVFTLPIWFYSKGFTFMNYFVKGPFDRNLDWFPLCCGGCWSGDGRLYLIVSFTYCEYLISTNFT